ncbi:MAG: AAA family ATPase [Planctomycetes bacterium]|nr:AAA family ATPase [Planctomycetota bacterium]
MTTLRRVQLKGFKSIKEMSLELRPLNVLIGENGAGKSNLVAFFKMLQEIGWGRLQQHVITSGHAKSILRLGPKVTPQIDARLEFKLDNGEAAYGFTLAHAAGDALVFTREELSFLSQTATDPTVDITYGPGPETRIIQESDSNGRARMFQQILNRCRVYHFHDTSATARVRQSCYVQDNSSILSDGGNLAAVLLYNQNYNVTSFRRIESTIRQISPFFHGFALRSGPAGTEIFLNWRETGSDEVFGPHQLSDGTLRAICLVTLLMQPEDGRWPDLIVIDEPELGLHPYALNIVASLLKKVSHHTQVIVSTQSISLVDHFDPEDVIVVNREGNGPSQFSRLEPQQLETWLDEYSLGEIWEKNVIGGGPH